MKSSPLSLLRHPRRVLFRNLVLFAVVILAAVFGIQAPGHRAAAAQSAPAPTVQARTGILIDRVTGRVLWSKSPDRRLGPASLTKVMTAILILQRIHDLDSYCRVPRMVGKEELGNVVGLHVGERISVRQALRALIVKSANDAAVTLAYRAAGSEPAFAKLMNAKARALGLTNTHFVNARGKPVPGHYSSARDLAKLGRYVMRNAEFRDLCRRKTATIRWPGHAVPVASHNRLLSYAWVDGVKTGATAPTGMCLIGSGRPGLQPLIVVTLHEPSRGQEVIDALAMFKWGSALYEQRSIVTQGDIVGTVPLAGGWQVAAVAATPLSAVVRSAAIVTTRRTLPALLDQAPPDGTLLGSVTYLADGQKLGTVRLVAGVAATPSPGVSSR